MLNAKQLKVETISLSREEVVGELDGSCSPDLVKSLDDTSLAGAEDDGEEDEEKASGSRSRVADLESDGEEEGSVNSDDLNGFVGVKRKKTHSDGDKSKRSKQKKDESDEEGSDSESREKSKEDSEIEVVEDEVDNGVTVMDTDNAKKSHVHMFMKAESEDDVVSVDDDDEVAQVDGADSVDEDEDEEPRTLVKSVQKPVKVASHEILEEQEVLLVYLAQEQQPGVLIMIISYTGVLDDSMRGFYRTLHPQGWGAACHFEATGARKCFPCLDQPEFRATFGLSVSRPASPLTVLSNMPVEREEGGVVKFQTCPALPSYLCCVVVGYYSSLGQRSPGGVQVSSHPPPCVHHHLTLCRYLCTHQKERRGRESTPWT